MKNWNRFHLWAAITLTIAIVAALRGGSDLSVGILAVIANIWWISGELLIEMRKLLGFDDIVARPDHASH